MAAAGPRPRVALPRALLAARAQGQAGRQTPCWGHQLYRHGAPAAQPIQVRALWLMSVSSFAISNVSANLKISIIQRTSIT